MSLQSNVNFNTTPTHVYYDINIINNDKTGSSPPAPVVFNDTRSDVIIRNPSEYFLSVNRFTLDTPSLPLFVPIIETFAGTGYDTTIYKIGYGYGANSTVVNKTFPILFTPQNLTIPPPTVDSVRKNNIQEYFYVNSFQYFIDLINSSSANFMAGNVGNDRIPFWTFNKETNKASILFPQPNPTTVQAWGGDYDSTGTSLTDPHFLYLNGPLYNLFSSFQANYVGSINVAVGPEYPNGIDDSGWYRLTINPANGTSVYTGAILPPTSNLLGVNTVPKTNFPYINTSFYNTSTTNFTVLEQDYPTTPLWVPVQAIVFTAALMPIFNELTGVPNVFNDNFNGFNSGGNNRNASPILTDVEVPLTRGDEYKPNIYYLPQPEYRLIDLQSNMPVNSIQISIFWKDNYGSLHPLLLNAGCCATLKLMFRKKTFNVPSI